MLSHFHNFIHVFSPALLSCDVSLYQDTKTFLLHLFNQHDHPTTRTSILLPKSLSLSCSTIHIFFRDTPFFHRGWYKKILYLLKRENFGSRAINQFQPIYSDGDSEFITIIVKKQGCDTAAIRCVKATVDHELQSFNTEDVIAFVTSSHGDKILNEVFSCNIWF